MENVKLSLVLLLMSVSFAWSQGSLAPSAPPGPTMKTLQQIEPRTSVHTLAGDASFLHIINQPGSYYLTTNIQGVAGKSGISVQAQNVVLDLNGFAVLGASGTGTGIFASGGKNVVVRNGFVRGWSSQGLSLFNVDNAVIENVQSHDNGGLGIRAGAQAQIKDCSSSSNATLGIVVGADSTVENCLVRSNGSTGIAVSNGGTVRNCTTSFNGTYGISGENNCSFLDCTIRSNGWSGIYALDGCVVKGCVLSGNGISALQDGLRLGDANTIENCMVSGSGYHGIYADLNNVIKNCVSILNAQSGFLVWQGSSLVNCTAGTNSASGFQLGPDVLVRECSAVGNAGGGMQINAGSQVLNNVVNRNGSHGITTTFTASRFEANTIISNQGYGLYLFGTNNFAIRNSARGNSTANYGIVGGNHYGPVIASPGAAFTNSNPWANFQF